MEQRQLRQRFCMAKFVGGAHGPSHLVTCEVERTKLELKSASACGRTVAIPDEVLDISGSLSRGGEQAA